MAADSNHSQTPQTQTQPQPETTSTQSGISNRAKVRIGTGIAAIAALATLMANLESIEKFIHPTPDISGHWELNDTITHSSMNPYIGLSATYSVSIQQTGETFAADGEKILVNDVPIPRKCRPPIKLSGNISRHPFSGDQVNAVFDIPRVPDCPWPETHGTFTWKLSSHGVFRRQGDELKGTFTGDAAETRGDSIGSR